MNRFIQSFQMNLLKNLNSLNVLRVHIVHIHYQSKVRDCWIFF